MILLHLLNVPHMPCPDTVYQPVNLTDGYKVVYTASTVAEKRFL